MGIFLGIAVLVIAGAMFIEGYNKYLYNKDWVKGVDYDGPSNSWVIGRVAADPDKKEFHIKLNSDDGHFYDENEYG